MIPSVKNFLYSSFLVIITAYASTYFTRFGIYNWYASLDKPVITPPDYIFSVVWTGLYILIIMAFYYVLQNKRSIHFKEAQQLFLAQLLLQIIWCFAFFYQGYIAIALGIILLLDIIVYKMMRVFDQVKRNLGYLILPYFIWICYATLINISFLYIHGFIVEFW